MGRLAIFVFFGNMESQFGLRVLLLDIQKVKYHGGFSPLTSGVTGLKCTWTNTSTNLRDLRVSIKAGAKLGRSVFFFFPSPYCIMQLNFDFVSLVGSKCKLRVIEFPQFYCLCLS